MIKVVLRTILVIQFDDLCDGHSREGNPTQPNCEPLSLQGAMGASHGPMG